MTRPKALLFAAYLALGMFLIGGAARADREDWNAGRALVLFRLGRVDLEAGRYAEALAKFTDSHRLDPGAGTLLNIAFCHAKLGKVASAWAEYNAAAVLAREQAKPDWERDALEQAARLDTFLPRVVIRVQEPMDGEWPEVLLDKTPVPRSLWGEATPVDPGPHEVLATALAKRTWSKTFDVDGEREPTVTVPVLEPAAPRVPAPTPEGAAVRAATDQGAKNSPHEGGRFWTPRKMAALALGGAGVVAVGVGGGLALVAKSTFASASSDCTVGGCGPRGTDQQSRAYREAGSATVATAVGGALLFDAVLVWLTGSSPPGGPRLQPALASTSCGASITGTW